MDPVKGRQRLAEKKVEDRHLNAPRNLVTILSLNRGLRAEVSVGRRSGMSVKRSIAGAIASLCLLGGGGFGRVPPMTAPSARHTVDALFPNAYYDYLLNGLQVIILERPETSEAIVSLMFKSGAAFDRAGKSGTAAVTARAIWLGAEDLSETTVRQRLTALEATIHTDVTWDATTITLTAPARGLPELLRLMARVVSRPSFEATALEALKARILEEVNAKRRDPSQIADQQWYRALYHPHPYARPPEGLPEEIATITPLDVARHHARFFIANTATLIILSPFAPATLMPIVRPSFGALLKGKIVPPTFLAPASRQGVRILLRDLPDAPLAHIRIGSFGLERFSEDYIPALVLAEVIRLRYEQELSRLGGPPARAHCRFDLRAQRGSFMLAVAVPTEHVVAALQRAQHVLTELRATGPTPEELADAQRRWEEQFSPSALSPRHLVEVLQHVELYGLGRDYLQRLPERLHRVTREDIRRVAETYLSPHDLLIVVVGRVQGLPDALRALGTVEMETNE
jgi:zinc protease